MRQRFMAFAAMAVVLLLAFSVPWINEIAAAIGLFLTNAVVALSGLHLMRQESARQGELHAD